jgi:hypothetical protein
MSLSSCDFRENRFSERDKLLEEENELQPYFENVSSDLDGIHYKNYSQKSIRLY